MPTAVIRSAEGVGKLADKLGLCAFPITVSWSKGAPRSKAQNRLLNRWYADIARQIGDQTQEEVRAYCKLTFGVPILRRESESFEASFQGAFDHLPYETKLAAMQNLDIPVTRLMTTALMAEYMQSLQRHWSSQCVSLTDPDAMKYEEEFS